MEYFMVAKLYEMKHFRYQNKISKITAHINICTNRDLTYTSIAIIF